MKDSFKWEFIFTLSKKTKSCSSLSKSEKGDA